MCMLRTKAKYKMVNTKIALTLDSTIVITPNKKHIKDKSQLQLGT